mmetsp:Transcript_109818/g.189991  ORF Transcript_109818/g.189991 Transcript_109818/m.189991 type:complete len:1135 (-) Transcript_109818:126-3530(-)
MVAEVMPPVEPGGAADLESAALLLYSQKFAKAPSEELSEYDTIYEGMDDVNCDRSEDTIMPSSRAELLSEIMPCAKKPSATVHSMPGPRRQYQSRTGGTPMNYIPIASRNCFRAPSQGYGGVPDMPADSETERFDLDADVGVCDQCGLPLGDVSYHSEGNGEGPLVHAECYVDLTLRSLKKDEQEYQQEESALKSSRRDEYDIGWNVECIPRNMVHAGKLDCQLVPQGMCCLKTDEGFTKLSCWPTIEPAAAVNLEYLSIALKVRGNEGREPMFSLDPVEATDSLDKNRMQVKRFEPEWLAGTSVGDVLFQADYHLKELSMGEYEQPVVGMKSCFDYSEQGEIDKEWNAREWFIVRKADVGITEDNVLVPRVKMGVEARELSFFNDEWVDVKCSRPNHPLVKYAEAFTKNFDLIAERKSVMFHLRELARASAMAKMLVDGDLCLPEGPWLALGQNTSEFCAMEVPQLWNHRDFVKMRVHNGQVENEADNGGRLRCHGVYGGVNFGLDKAGLTMPSFVASGRLANIEGGRPAAGLSAISTGSLSGISTLRASAAPAMGLSAMAGPPTLTAPLTAKVALSATGRPVMAAPSAAFAAVTAGLTKPVGVPGLLQVPPARIPKGLAGLLMPPAPTGPPTALIGEPASLLSGRAGLSAVSLSFITKPGAIETSKVALQPTRASFLPPRPSLGIQELAAPLISPEKPRGVDLNLDQFSLSEPTPIEGGCWGIEEQDVKCAPMGSAFWTSLDGACTEFKNEDQKLLKAIFDPQLSDRRIEGEQFVPPDTSCDYVQRLRSLVEEEHVCKQERKEHFFSEAFSTSSPGSLFPSSWAPSVEIKGERAAEDVKLYPRPDYQAQAGKFGPVLKSATPTFEKSTEEGLCFRIYNFGTLEVRTCQEPAGEETVGAVFSLTEPEKRASCCNKVAGPDMSKIQKVTEYVETANDGRRSFVVFETLLGNVIVTEKLVDGKTTWEENPADLDDRKALAKVVRTTECTQNGVWIRNMRNYQLKENTAAKQTTVSCSQCKLYAQGAYSRAVGELNTVYTGFRKQERVRKWQLSERLYGLYASTNFEAAKPAEELKVQWENGKRPVVGDMVQIKETGRKGKVEKDDGSATPYKVLFKDGQRPQEKWYKEHQLQFAK